MAWLSSLPGAIVISVEKYHETRIDPRDGFTEQIRDRAIITREYRGVTSTVADLALLGYPKAFADRKITRSAQMISGGGWIITEIEDTKAGGWVDDPTIT